MSTTPQNIIREILKREKLVRGKLHNSEDSSGTWKTEIAKDYVMWRRESLVT